MRLVVRVALRNMVLVMRRNLRSRPVTSSCSVLSCSDYRFITHITYNSYLQRHTDHSTEPNRCNHVTHQQIH